MAARDSRRWAPFHLLCSWSAAPDYLRTDIVLDIYLASVREMDHEGGLKLHSAVERFATNSVEARHYEDIIQCALDEFEERAVLTMTMSLGHL